MLRVVDTCTVTRLKLAVNQLVGLAEGYLQAMSSDIFDDLLKLEDGYYKEGYDEGVADSTYAGMIEGKVFGIEKGFEKALELGKLHGRSLIWQERSRPLTETNAVDSGGSPPTNVNPTRLAEIIQSLERLPEGARLRRHVEALRDTSDSTNIAKDNSDDAVTEFDDRIAKAKAKAKVIANIAGEPLNPSPNANAGIEDATGLQARH